MPSPENVVEVQAQDYEKLEAVLNSRFPTSGLIWNVLKLKQSLKKDDKISVKFFADESQEKWSTDTTTFMGVANVEGLPQNLNVICGPKTGPSKDAILRILSALDWTRENQFEGIENSVAPVLISEAKRYGQVDEHDPIALYFMHKHEALQILNEKESKLLSGPIIRGSSLRIKDAVMVEDRWPEKRTGYLNMLEASIESCSSGGIYLESENDSGKNTWNLVSFAVALPFGSIHAFHTEPEERRKGFGKLTMKVLSKNIAEAGRIPLVQIYKTNDGSKALNEGIGFKYSHDINLIHFIPN